MTHDTYDDHKLQNPPYLDIDPARDELIDELSSCDYLSDACGTIQNSLGVAVTVEECEVDGDDGVLKSFITLGLLVNEPDSVRDAATTLAVVFRNLADSLEAGA